MGTTASGFWYPDANTRTTLQGMFNSTAVAAENSRTRLILTNGNPIAASLAALNAMYTAAGVAIVAGMGATIAGVPSYYNGTAWVSDVQRSVVEGASTGVASLATATWTQLPMATYTYGGPMWSVALGNTSTVGITAPIAGWYRVEVGINWSASAAGRRGVGIGPSSGSSPTSFTPSIATTAIPWVQTYEQTMLFAAGAIIAAFGYQDSGGGLNITNRRLFVEYLPTV